MDAASLDTHLASAGLQDNNTKTDSVLLDPKQTFEAELDLQESGNNSAYDPADNTNLFGDAVDLDTLAHLEVPDADADSVSVVPSIAQTSELCNVGSTGQSGISVGHVSSGKVDTQTAVEVAARSLRLEPVEPIWEQGIWGVIFGNKTMLDVYKPFDSSFKRPIDTSVPASSDSIAPSSSKPRLSPEPGLSFTDVVKDRPNISWQEQRDADLQSSVKFWMALVHRWRSDCSICLELEKLESTDRVFTMFAHLFAGRSPITTRKRGYSIMRVCDYLDEVSDFFPCSEEVFYNFLCVEQSRGAPQSRMKGYMQSVNFVRFVMSVEELSSVTTSARCKGACLGEFLKERIQASPLTVLELNRIHKLLQSCDDLWVKLFCGAVLMAVYARSRWGDLMRAERVLEDYDSTGRLCYLEARTGRHKTMKSQMHRHQFLPMVAPCFGIDGTNWGLEWTRVRQQLGLHWPPDGLVMPAPDREGVATERPLETQECAAWLRKLVGVETSSETRRVASHSLKSTMLSYAAKRGIGIPERLQLGYHTSNFQMGMVYSRDGAAASILVLEKLISEIAQGKFSPDETRSGRIASVEKVMPTGFTEVIEIKDEPDVVEDSESESGSDSSSTSSEEPRPESVKHPPVLRPTRAPEGFNLWQHKKLKTLHLMSIHNLRVFACGRTAGALHERLQEAPKFDTPLCTNCFHRKHE